MVPLAKVIDELDSLSKEDLRQLQVELHRRLAERPPTEAEFERVLEERPAPIPIAGTPFSEIIVQERR